MVKNVMAIGAHPDDIETGCFGALLYHLDKGDNVSVLITTRGGYSNRPWEIIKSEYENAEKILGVKYIVLNHPIANYEFNRATVRELDSIVENKDIDTIYCTWYGDCHQDHQHVFKNALSTSRKSRVNNLYCYELGNYSARTNLIFKPQLYIDITKHIDKKLEAIESYKSYYTDDNSIENIKLLSRIRGTSIGVEHAEAFEIIFETWRG